MTFAQYYDENQKPCLGSDGVARVDGRQTLWNQAWSAADNPYKHRNAVYLKIFKGKSYTNCRPISAFFLIDDWR